MRISVVLPVLESDVRFYLRDCLRELSHDRRIEAICIDAGSSATIGRLCETHGARYVSSRSQKRADRLTEGIARSTGDWIVFHHPRSFLKKEGLLELASLDPGSPVWGAWTHSFDRTGRFYAFTSWYSNRIRGDLKGIFYLDHCLFLSRRMLDLVGPAFIPSVAIFEDALISRILGKVSRPRRLAGTVTTSCVRFATNGVVRQAATNQMLKLCFLARLPDGLLNRKYDGKMKLNGAVDG